MKTGIIGLPQVGKTSLFKILTRADISNRSSNPREAHIGIATVPDDRLDRLAAQCNPRKLVHAQVEFADVGAIGQEALKETAYLANLRGVDALVHVLRVFEDDLIPHVGGSLDPVRDLTFIDDTVAGFLRAAEAEGVLGQVINLGTGAGVTIGELAHMVFQQLGVEPEVVLDPRRIRPAASEVRRLISDNRKAARLLGWQPAVSLAEGLGRTIAWVRAHAGLYQPQEYSL